MQLIKSSQLLAGQCTDIPSFFHRYSAMLTEYLMYPATDHNLAGCVSFSQVNKSAVASLPMLLNLCYSTSCATKYGMPRDRETNSKVPKIVIAARPDPVPTSQASP